MKGKKHSLSTRVLAWTTRLIFLLLVIFCTTQITCAVVFMLMCRQSSRDLVLGLDLSNDPCQSQGIPAYIAFVVLLVTVFGFGCVGRKCTSIAILLLGICDIGISIYLQIDRSAETFSGVEHDLNRTLSFCSETDFMNSKDDNNKTLMEHDSTTSCNNIHSTLVRFCPAIGEWWNTTLIDENIENCSTIIQQILENIKFQYYPYSVPLTFCGSVAYIILSVALFYVQYRDKQLPGYHHKAHMLHVPEFQDHPSAEDNLDSGPKLTPKLCLVHILSCRCMWMFPSKYCCGVKQSTQPGRDVYEFEVLPTKVANETNEDQSASDTQLV